MKRKHLTGDGLRTYNYNHTKQRIEERYGLTLSKSNYENLCQRILKRNSVFELKREKQKRGTQIIFKLKYKQCNIYVVFLDTIKAITTALPPNNFERL